MTPISPEDILISRISPNTPRTDFLRGIVGNLFGLRTRLANERARLAADRNVSDVGRRGQEATLAKSLVKNLAELSQTLRLAKADIAARRACFKLPEVDRTDIVGEHQRQEVRTYLRSLPLAERVGAIETLGDAGVLAVISAAPSLSGLPPDRHEFLKTRYLEKLFGPQMKELESIEDDYTGVDSAQQMVSKELQAATGLGFNDFSALVKSHES